jgi:group I intron endonuclease
MLKEIPSTSGIYCFRNTLNEKRYIGQAQDMRTRVLKHIGNAHSSDKTRRTKSKLYASIRKYGLASFEVSVIEFADCSKLTEREEFWIEHYKTYLPKYGYNLSRFGDTNRGVKRSKAFRKACSDRAKAWSKTNKNPMLGKVQGYETRKKISEASFKRWGDKSWVKKIWINSGLAKRFSEERKHNPTFAAGCVVYDLSGLLLGEFRTRKEAISFIGADVKYGKISKNGMILFRLGESPENILQYIELEQNRVRQNRVAAHSNGAVLQYDGEVLVGKYKSAKEAQSKTGIKQAGISRAIREGSRAGGYFWTQEQK